MGFLVSPLAPALTQSSRKGVWGFGWPGRLQPGGGRALEAIAGRGAASGLRLHPSPKPRLASAPTAPEAPGQEERKGLRSIARAPPLRGPGGREGASLPCPEALVFRPSAGLSALLYGLVEGTG